MLIETALMGIACMISNAPAADREEVLNGLTPQEVVAVQEKEKLCVPDRLKQILEQGREQAARGTTDGALSESQPTFRC
jgi:hypothetical protein